MNGPSRGRLETAVGVLGLAVALLEAPQAGAAEDWVTVRPADTGEALVNPGMGWALHFYSNFIDIGSFGMWGEGHTGFSSRLNEAQTLAVVKKHIDLHIQHFRKTLLCISDDVAGSGKPGRHFPEMDYAPPIKPGTHDVFVSVGQRDGTPRIALPLPLPDGQGRYRLGRMILK